MIEKYDLEKGFRVMMFHFEKKNLYKWCAKLLLCATVVGTLNQPLQVQAANADENLAYNRSLTIQSNQIANWPEGPVVGAESAILMEAETGAILYAKNIHQKEYPASTTKILTCLIAAEQCSLSEEVTFSHDAVYDTPRDSNHIAIDEGEVLTMEQCLNAILIRSANEVSFAVAEHITGDSWESFADIMNARAEELGAINSNFVNPNGLPDENHYTTAYDLAMIGRGFFSNEMLCKISTTYRLEIPASDKQPDNIVEVSSNKLINGGYNYEYLVGCKTGYTNDARSCLVSCAEKDGMRLICVVMKDEAPYQYEDTIALFNYGFSNFDKINVSQTETKYNIDNAGFFYSDNDIFGSSKPILSLNEDDCIILPKTADFKDTVSTISYDTENENQAALITYTYHDTYIGSASVDFATNNDNTYSFDTITSQTGEDSNTAEETNKEPSFIFINVVKLFFGIVGVVALVALVIFVIVFFKNYQFERRNTRFAWRMNRRKRQNRYQNANNSLHQKRKEQIKAAKRRQRKSRNTWKQNKNNRDFF